MDYGKLAYLKAEELEQRLLNFGRDEESRSLHISATLNGASGYIPIAIVSGTGSVGYVAKVYAAQSVGKKAGISVGGVVSGEAEVNDNGEAIVIGCAVLGGGETVGLNTDAEVDRVEIVFCGNASVAARAIEVDAVGLDDTAGIITSSIGKVRLTIADASALNKGVDAAEGKVAGFGTSAAIAAYSDCFIIAYANESGITVAKADKSGLISEIHEIAIEGNITDVAVGRMDSRLVIAYIVDGEIAYGNYDADTGILFGGSRSGIRADKVMLCGEENFLIFSAGGKCFLKEFEKTLVAEAKVKMKIGVYANSEDKV